MKMNKKAYTTPMVAIKGLHMEHLLGNSGNSLLTPTRLDFEHAPNLKKDGAIRGEGPTDFAKPNGGDIEWDL